MIQDQTPPLQNEKSNNNMSFESNSFLLADYQARKHEITSRMERVESDIKNSILATGALWAWIFANGSSGSEPIIWIPALLNLFLALKGMGQHKAVKEIKAYIKKIELEIKIPEELGVNGVKGAYTFLEYFTWSFWLFMIVGNVVVAKVYACI